LHSEKFEIGFVPDFFTLTSGSPLFGDGLPRKTLVASATFGDIQMSKSQRMGAGPRLKLLFGGWSKFLGWDLAVKL
jgi:hypothetical protein